MNLDELKRVLDLVREYDLAQLEVEHEGLRLHVVSGRAPAAAQPSAAPAQAFVAQPGPVVAVAAPPPAAGQDELEGVDLAVVKSPIVGTFYRANEPGAAPFVEVGGHVRQRQVLCIIEAMKLMNEIESEYDGEIVKVYVENGQPVQYGERLFAIKVK
ncbi:MAG: acetyl-CoA carboxylase biotin carboxyl carrier protein [Vicinamibacterales bacterium]